MRKMKWNKIQDKFVKTYETFTKNKFKKLLNKIRPEIKEGEISSSTLPTIKDELNKIGTEQNKLMDQILFNTSKKILKNKKAINKILKQKWTDTHYSERIWNDKKKLYKVLKKELHKAVKDEKSREHIIKLISNKFDVSVYQAKRLVDTEISNVINQSIVEQGKLLRKKRYKIVVQMDERTSDICKRLYYKNEEYDLNAVKVPGENWVPAHPNCRSRIELVN